MKRLATLLLAALALVAAAAIPASASARDRNHDRIPDKWEKRHHLSLHHNQARRDQDRDGMRNRAEWKYGFDPRDRDSDDDGVRDSKENAGTVKSFADGVLTISLAKGGDVSGAVTGATEIECETGEQHAGDDHGDDGPTHDAGDDQGDDGPTHDAGDDHGDDDSGHHGDDDSGDDHSGPGAHSTSDDDHRCSADALKAGAVVREAELKLTDGGAVWREVELLG
jgi:hypothetical protein